MYTDYQVQPRLLIISVYTLIVYLFYRSVKVRLMSDKTVILPVKIKESDLEELKRVIGEDGNTSALVRTLLTDFMRDKSPKFSGEIVNGGARPGAGRKPSTRAS